MKQSNSNTQQSTAIFNLQHLYDMKRAKDETIPKKKFFDDSTNALTASIMKYLELVNVFGARINVQGQYQPKKKVFSKSHSTLGMPDITCIVKGQFVGIEVKYGLDKQSKIQKEVQDRIEASGGVYYVAKTFEAFYNWFNAKFKIGTNNSYVEKSCNTIDLKTNNN